jgi:hypothetical protein
MKLPKTKPENFDISPSNKPFALLVILLVFSFLFLVASINNIRIN